MKDKTSHNLAVRKPLSKVYLALFSAPLILIGPADVARADVLFLMVNHVLPNL